MIYENKYNLKPSLFKKPFYGNERCMVAYHFLEFWKVKDKKERMREREKKTLRFVFSF